jgi:para-nitrobenzyl esterase
LLDQIRALEWVRDRIAQFGGDPGDITVAGQSAGATSILAMLSAPAGRGLFRRAILQSTPGAMLPISPAQAEVTGRRFLEVLGADAQGVHSVPVTDLLSAQQRMIRAGSRGPLDVMPPFHPVAVPGLVDGDPLTTVGSRGAEGVALLIGTTGDEAAAFFAGDDRAEALTSAQLDAIARDWFGDDSVSRDPVAMSTEYMFRRPAARLAALLSEAGNPCRTYHFTWHPPRNPLSACHCMELPFLFGNSEAWQRAPMLAGADPALLDRITDSVQRTWLAFVRDEPLDPAPPWGYTSEGTR